MSFLECRFVRLRQLVVHLKSPRSPYIFDDGSTHTLSYNAFLRAAPLLEYLNVQVEDGVKFLNLGPPEMATLHSIAISSNPESAAFLFIARQACLEHLSVLFGNSSPVRAQSAFLGSSNLERLKALRTDDVTAFESVFSNGVAGSAISQLRIEGLPKKTLNSRIFTNMITHLRCLELCFSARQDLDAECLALISNHLPHLMELGLERTGSLKGKVVFNVTFLASFIYCRLALVADSFPARSMYFRSYLLIAVCVLFGSLKGRQML